MAENAGGLVAWEMTGKSEAILLAWWNAFVVVVVVPVVVGTKIVGVIVGSTVVGTKIAVV